MSDAARRMDEGPDTPPVCPRAEAARMRRLLEALQAVEDGELTLEDVCRRFELSYRQVRKVARAHNVVVPRGQVWGR